MTSSTLWPDAPPPSSTLRVCVVLPVRNEAAGLARCLAALADQCVPSTQSGVQGFDRRQYEVLLLANNCSDASADIARAFAQQHPDVALHVAEVELPPPLANIGHVRRVLMDAAAARLQGAAADSVIASTDGDTLVAHDWLWHTLREIDAGADAVGGRIAIDASDDTDAALRRWRRCDTAYRLASERLASLLDPEPADPWPRHHQHFCGSLAVRRDAYLHVGGLPAVTFLEDEALVGAMRAEDLRVRHSPLVRVCTSGRQVGRAEVGLAWQLRQWAEQGAEGGGQMVEDAALLAARFAARRQLRVCFGQRGKTAGKSAEMALLASRWQLTWRQLAAMVEDAPTFGALWATLEARCQAQQPQQPQPTLVPIRAAIDGLRAMVAAHAQPAPVAAKRTVARRVVEKRAVVRRTVPELAQAQPA